MTRSGPGSGALLGLLLTASLTSVLYAAWRLFGLPFAPFDLFDWSTRLLPGSVVTGGIDLMVGAIRGLRLGPTSDVAKLAEQVMAVVGFLAAGTVAGALLFAVPGRRTDAPADGRAGGAGPLAGALLGGALGVAAAWIGAGLARPGGVAPWLGIAWTVAAGLAWGTLLGLGRRRLAGGRPGAVAASTAAPAATAEEAAEPGAAAIAADVAEGAAVAVAAARLDRRRFLVRVGTATAVITVGGAFVGVLGGGRRVGGAAGGAGPPPWSSDHPLPNADSPVRPAPGTRSELTPVPDHYRTDIDTVAPRVDGDSWRLRTGGLVASPREWTLAGIRDSYPPLHQFITLACISNPVGGDLIGTTRWTGASLRRMLPDLGLEPEATHLKITATDGFHEVVPLRTVREDERVMLTYAWDGLPLTAAHGYPLRIYIPDVYGMKQPKWIETIEGIDGWEAGYWVERGWDRTARMRATSVIDTVAKEDAYPDGGTTVVPVGGIAHAGDRGIGRVEVRVDDGPWRAAELREPLSGTTWVVWRLDWPFAEGRHAFTVRCVDGEGNEQVAEPAPPHPAGATGLDMIEADP